jgi:hypothetical protein
MGARHAMTLPIETVRLEALRKLAAERFGNVTSAEEKVLQWSASTEDLSTRASKDRPAVRAAFLRWLVTDEGASPHIDPLGLRVANTTVTSALNLDFCKVDFPLLFMCCTLQDELSLRSAELAALNLFNCTMENGITADGLRTRGSVLLRKLAAKGELRFLNAKIGSELDCSGATLTARGDALNVQNAFITCNVFLRNASSTGTIRLLGAQIGGDLDCRDATLTAAGNSLFADGAHVAGIVNLREKFSSSGTIRFLNAQIGGDLDCRGSTLTAKGITVWAERAKIDHSVFLGLDGFSSSGEIRIFGAQIGGDLDCRGATFTGEGNVLSADRSEIKGTVFLSQGFTSSGTVRLTGAQIGGDLDCSRATLTCKGDALHADRTNIAGTVFLSHSFSSGRLHFPVALIGGGLDCSGTVLTAKDDALVADEARIVGYVHFNQGFSCSGTIRLPGTQIDGDLDCTGATLTAAGDALNAEDARITRNVSLRKMLSTGTISLLGTQIGGDLDCLGATLRAKGAALIADRTNVAGGVFFISKFCSSGEIRMLGAQIGGDLNCSGATLTAIENVLYADGARITGTVYFVAGFSSAGTIRLPYAEIGGNLDCSGATLTAKQNTLYADGAKIGHSVFLRDGFSSSTTVRFDGARIGGDLDCSGAMIGRLECVGTQAGGDLKWTGIRRPEVANLDLSNASFTRLVDDRASWPLKGHLHLNGFVYQSLDPQGPAAAPENVAKDRTDWLKQQPDTELSKPQPWMQVAKMLESSGNPDGAKQVIYEFRLQQDRAAYPPLHLAIKGFDWVEEQPLHVSYPILLLWLLGSAVFWRARRMKAMVPTDEHACEEFRKSGEAPDQYVPFNPAMYALENVLPVVRLGQDDAWGPNPDARPASWFPRRKYMAWTRWLPSMNYRWLAILRWTLILLGWALALILAAAISERFKH